MENTKVYTDENGNQIKLEEISTFKIEELNKKRISKSTPENKDTVPCGYCIH